MKPYGHNATLMMLFVGTGLSVTQSQRVFKIKKYASVTFSKWSILPSNYPREVNQTLMAFKRTNRSACQLKNWDLSLCHLQFKKTFFLCFIKVSDMLVLLSSNNKMQLRSSRVALKTNKSFLSVSKSVLFTNWQENMQESYISAVQFVAQNTQSTHRTETALGWTVSIMIPNYES